MTLGKKISVGGDTALSLFLSLPFLLRSTKSAVSLLALDVWLVSVCAWACFHSVGDCVLGLSHLPVLTSLPCCHFLGALSSLPQTLCLLSDLFFSPSLLFVLVLSPLSISVFGVYCD